MAIVIPTDGALFIAEALRRGFAVGTFAHPIFTALFQGATIPTVDSVIADLTEVTFGGYARQLTLTNPASLYPDKSARITLVGNSAGGPITFNQSGAPNAVATGYFCLINDWTNTARLLCLERTQKRVQFNGPGSVLQLIIPLGFLTAFSG
jgi:hypothetical protein